jgi:translation initiation factor 2B subunit (eIF-2B alpha/beta/delta family)
MDPWDHIRRAAADRRSGSAAIAARAAAGIAGLQTRRDVLRAARALLRAHPAMAPLWRLCAEAYDADEPGRAAERFGDRLEQQTTSAVDGIRWVLTKRNAVVVTHSASSTVVRALERVRARVSLVLCTASLPGGEGRSLAARLERMGFDAEVVPDAGIARACARAHVALVGADGVTGEAVVNKIGTHPLALSALDARIGCYAIAPSLKLLPGSIWARADAPSYEATPLELFDAVLTERGPRRAAAIRRAVARVRIPSAIAGVLK